MKMQRKDDFWQLVRSFCIMAVIMIHCPNAIDYVDQPYSYYSWVIIRQIVNFPVAVFIFLSGYFLNIQKIQHNYREYLYNRCVNRLFIPFLIWSIIYTMIHSIRLILDGISVNWIDRVISILLGKAAAPFYYILVLLQLLILSPLFIKLIDRKLSFIPYLITIVYIGYLYSFTISKGHLPILYATLFFPWAGFYMLGIQGRYNRDFLKLEYTNQSILLSIVFGIVLQVMETIVMQHTHVSIDLSCSQLKITSLLYAFVIITILLSKHGDFNKSERFDRKYILLKEIGDRSYGIYYIHYFVVTVFKSLLSRTVIASYYVLFFAVVFICSLITSLALIWLIRGTAFKSGKANYLKYMGLN